MNSDNKLWMAAMLGDFNQLMSYWNTEILCNIKQLRMWHGVYNTSVMFDGYWPFEYFRILTFLGQSSKVIDNWIPWPLMARNTLEMGALYHKLIATCK